MASSGFTTDELLPELHLFSESWPLADTIDGYTVDLSYIAREASDIHVSLMKSEFLIHDALIVVTGGSGVLSLEFIFAEKPAPGADYQLVGALFIRGQESAIAGDTLKNLEILETEDPVGVIRIYPNPASGRIMVHIPESMKHVESLNITDINGRILLQLKDNLKQNKKEEIHIDISSLQPGYYILNCKADKSHYSTGFIVD